MPSKIKVEIGGSLRKGKKIVRRLRYKRANSLLKQFIQILAVQMANSAFIVRRVSGEDVSLSPYYTKLRVNAPADNTTYGIMIGNGTDPVTMSDWKLQNKLTTGIAHSAHTIAVENPDSSTWRLSISRAFTNNSGATIQVREVGLYEQGGVGISDTHCIDRTLYSVDVPNGVSLTLTYRITISL